MFRNQNAQQQQQYQQQQQQPMDGQQQEEQAQPATELKLAASGGNIDFSQAYGNDRRTQSGKFTLAQLRATEGICPLQNGTNQFDSQKGKTSFGTPRNTQKRVEFAESGNNHRYVIDRPEGVPDTEIRLQSGTNKFDSQKKMTGFGTPRDVKGKHLKRIWELEFPEEAADYQPPINAAPQQFQQGQPQQQQYQQYQQGQQQPQYGQQPQQPFSPNQPQQYQQQVPPQQQQQPQRPGQPQQFQQGQQQSPQQRPGQPQQQFGQQQAQKSPQPGQPQQPQQQQYGQQQQQFQRGQPQQQGQQQIGGGQNAAPAAPQKAGVAAPSFR